MDNITEACWEGYRQIGMKAKGDKMVPDCVPIKEENEEVITEVPAVSAHFIGKGINSWITAISGLVASGQLTPVQGVVVGFGVPAVLVTGGIMSGDMVRSVKQFVRDTKDKRKINPEQTKELVSQVVAATKKLPKYKQGHLTNLMTTHQDAITSGDKNKILSAQRELKAYSNTQIDKDNQEMEMLHRMRMRGPTSKKSASPEEKQIAPQGAIHAGWGRWTDSSGKTLGFTRDGKWVPVKQKLQEDVDNIYDGEFCPACLHKYILEHVEMLEEAEYQGRKVSLGKPFRTSGGPKKFSVYVKNKKGNTIKVNFGDPNMKIKKNIPGRRKSFRARHKCSTAKDRTSARYWSCRAW
jgi:hypothetical protein